MGTVGLREIKKNKLKQAVQRETLRLFEQQGYERTTVEQIADAAEISTTTFYRYFSSKDDVILTGAYDIPSAEGGRPFTPLSDRPEGEPLIDSLRAVIRESLADGMLGRDRDELLARLQMIFRIPELEASHAARLHTAQDELARLLAGTVGGDPDSYDLRVRAAMLAGALAETLRYWADHDGEPDLGVLFDDTLERVASVIDRP